MNLGQISIGIVGDTTKINNSLKQVNKNVEGISNSFQIEFGKLDSIIKGFTIGGIGAAASAAADDIQKAFNTIEYKTGKTGADLVAFNKEVLKSFESTPYGLDNIAGGFSSLRATLDGTNSEVMDLTERLLYIGKMEGISAEQIVPESGRLLQAWGMGTGKEGSKFMDELYTIAVRSSKSTSEMMGKLSTYSDPLKAAGYDAKNAAALIASLEKFGTSSELLLNGIRKAMNKIVREDPDDAAKIFHSFVKEIEDYAKAGNDAAGQKVSQNLFGALAGIDMYESIKRGDFTSGKDEILKDAEENQRNLLVMAERQKTFADEIQIMLNQLKQPLAELGDVLQPVVRDTISPLLQSIGQSLVSFTTLITPLLNSSITSWLVKLKLLQTAFGGLKSFADSSSVFQTFMTGFNEISQLSNKPIEFGLDTVKAEVKLNKFQSALAQIGDPSYYKEAKLDDNLLFSEANMKNLKRTEEAFERSKKSLLEFSEVNLDSEWTVSSENFEQDVEKLMAKLRTKQAEIDSLLSNIDKDTPKTEAKEIKAEAKLLQETLDSDTKVLQNHITKMDALQEQKKAVYNKILRDQAIEEHKGSSDFTGTVDMDKVKAIESNIDKGLKGAEKAKIDVEWAIEQDLPVEFIDELKKKSDELESHIKDKSLKTLNNFTNSKKTFTDEYNSMMESVKQETQVIGSAFSAETGKITDQVLQANGEISNAINTTGSNIVSDVSSKAYEAGASITDIANDMAESAEYVEDVIFDKGSAIGQNITSGAMTTAAEVGNIISNEAMGIETIVSAMFNGINAVGTAALTSLGTKVISVGNTFGVSTQAMHTAANGFLSALGLGVSGVAAIAVSKVVLIVMAVVVALAHILKDVKGFALEVLKVIGWIGRGITTIIGGAIKGVGKGVAFVGDKMGRDWSGLEDTGQNIMDTGKAFQQSTKANEKAYKFARYDDKYRRLQEKKEEQGGKLGWLDRKKLSSYEKQRNKAANALKPDKKTVEEQSKVISNHYKDEMDAVDKRRQDLMSEYKPKLDSATGDNHSKLKEEWNKRDTELIKEREELEKERDKKLSAMQGTSLTSKNAAAWYFDSEEFSQAAGFKGTIGTDYLKNLDDYVEQLGKAADLGWEDAVYKGPNGGDTTEFFNTLGSLEAMKDIEDMRQEMLGNEMRSMEELLNLSEGDQDIMKKIRDPKAYADEQKRKDDLAKKAKKEHDERMKLEKEIRDNRINGMKEYLDLLEKEEKRLKNLAGLTQKLTKKDMQAKSPFQILKAQQMRESAMVERQAALDNLRSRGISGDLYDELQNLGIKDLPVLKGVAQLNNQQLLAWAQSNKGIEALAKKEASRNVNQNFEFNTKIYGEHLRDPDAFAAKTESEIERKLRDRGVRF